jgi:hypothetical protein
LSGTNHTGLFYHSISDEKKCVTWIPDVIVMMQFLSDAASNKVSEKVKKTSEKGGKSFIIIQP